MPQIGHHNLSALQAFQIRHGKFVKTDDGFLIFQDGATAREDDGFGRLCDLREPPEDAMEQLRMRRIYTATVLAEEESTWQSFKNEVLGHANMAVAYPATTRPPAADAPQQLARGKQRIQALREQLREIDETLAATPVSQTRQRLEGFRKEDLSERRQLQKAIMAITLD